MASIQAQFQNGPLDYLENVFIFETINARSALRDPLRRTAEWPRRLLHTETMTSYEKNGQDEYSNVCEPVYNVLSYTWGRFRNPSGSAVTIQNIPWEVPHIDAEKHFTAEQFQTVIQLLASPNFASKSLNESSTLVSKFPADGKLKREVKFLWIDIACINQHNSEERGRERMEEINKQAVIFGRAETVYVWLSHCASGRLAELLLCVGDSARYLERYLDLPPTASSGINREDMFAWLDSATPPIVALLSDPWFTSLWTMQEGFLRQDAILLSLDAKPVPLEHATRGMLERNIQRRKELVMRDDYDLHELATCGAYWTVSTLAAVLSLIRQLLQYVLLDESLSKADMLYAKTRDLWFIIGNSGLSYFNTYSPFALYHATKFRTAERKLDRIYGCMQIFNVHLGRPNRLFMPAASLDDLNDELVIWLTNRHGNTSQMFIHTEQPAEGKSWRFLQSSAVTEDFMPTMLPSNRRYIGFWVARPTSWGLHFSGIACRLEVLARRWSSPQASNATVSDREAGLSLHRPAVGALVSIALDENEHLVNVPLHLKAPDLRISERMELVDWLVKHLSATTDSRVVLLGDFVDSLRSRTDCMIYYCMGIILMHKFHNGHGSYWQRLGVCLWESNMFPLRNEYGEGKWELIDGLYA